MLKDFRGIKGLITIDFLEHGVTVRNVSYS